MSLSSLGIDSIKRLAHTECSLVDTGMDVRLGRKEKVRDVAAASDLLRVGRRRTGLQGPWKAMSSGGH